MENTIYNIILANGTEIHATINGNNYITDDAVNIEILSDANLSNVNIGGVTNHFQNSGLNLFLSKFNFFFLTLGHVVVSLLDDTYDQPGANKYACPVIVEYL